MSESCNTCSNESTDANGTETKAQLNSMMVIGSRVWQIF